MIIQIYFCGCAIHCGNQCGLNNVVSNWCLWALAWLYGVFPSIAREHVCTMCLQVDIVVAGITLFKKTTADVFFFCIPQFTLTRRAKRFRKISLISLHFQRDNCHSNEKKTPYTFCAVVSACLSSYYLRSLLNLRTMWVQTQTNNWIPELNCVVLSLQRQHCQSVSGTKINIRSCKFHDGGSWRAARALVESCTSARGELHERSWRAARALVESCTSARGDWWWFLPKILGPWWGPTKVIYRSVNRDRVLIIFASGGDTWTQFCVIKLIWTFCTERWWGANNQIFWSCKLVVQINLYVNSLSACCDTGNEYGVVILCANWLCKLVVQNLGQKPSINH